MTVTHNVSASCGWLKNTFFLSQTEINIQCFWLKSWHVYKTSYMHHLWAVHLTCLQLTGERLGTVTKPFLCSDSSETESKDNEGFHRWATLFTWIALSGHSQIRLCVPSPLCSRLALLLFSLLLRSPCVSLCWLRKFTEKSWEQHILLHNLKLNWDDRVVFSRA